jgi:hypothetical protein
MYCSIVELRAYEPKVTAADEAVTLDIQLAMNIIDRETRQWFEPRTKTLQLTGNNIKDLVLPAPAIGITSIKIDDEELDSEYYKVVQDDLRSMAPMLRHKTSVWPQDSEIEVEGSFGFVGDDKVSTPPEVKRLCMILAAKISLKDMESDQIKSERIGDYSYSKADEANQTFMGSAEAHLLMKGLVRLSIGVF